MNIRCWYIPVLPLSMSHIICHDTSRLLAWATPIIGCGPARSDAQAIGLERDGALVAVTYYDGFSATDCNIHVASDGSGRWLTREFLAHVFAYPFIQLSLRRVTGLVPVNNPRALQFDLKLGFRLEGCCRDALPDGTDLYILGMLRRECRWITPEYRK
ncbi:MAG: GNAT family N-acetyltransferase [Enterobacteriaceae bacterium]